ncbi:hypothetical protein HOE22_10835 [Candidatus Woesearchaeota archaeon]|nr:hypothetical protein [Candidatus Woesearchaeota archaeon]MBT4732545.1 hypothetical protein [Candidatus Woesearchaeota archaeon]MBT7558758.1 hypothetical protein [Candidatus Woesearchaeota archaeon]
MSIKYEPTFGEYVVIRMKEENISWKDLDEDTIDFFHTQWLIDRKRVP